MIPIQIRPDQVMDELTTFQNKLTQGLQNLADAGDIPAGVTPKEAVYKEDKLTLYRFQAPASVVQHPIPVLIVYALVNRPYMTDLQDDRSTVKGLLEAGMDVYLIDWGYPDRADRFLTMDDYLNGYVDRCVDEICRRHNLDKINLLGICQGGTFSLCYSAMHPEKVQNLITMVTPVDFHTPGNILSHWVKHVDIDTLVDTMGNIPGELLNWTFLNLKPYQLMGQKYLDMVEVLQDKDKLDNFLRMEKWIFDSPDQAGETYRQFIKDFYQQNKLMNGDLHIGEYEVNLANVTMPVLNIFAEQDHLVPPDASKALAGKVGTKDYTELSFPGGHIGIYVSGKAQKTVPPAIGKWVKERG
ncbi:poly(R)-hydroxyalkanoic acid synthase, class III, PhaC subunit [Ectothiorhodospira sp. PHS-1]|uniref:class III poly(R)-hydroxyalkanoic acid synthase subunit PhaC n=1 Tax=Ectothiorhodospira sp. PHS-1 TaxID=519989 RepID=UPI00024A8493|nr:class III poly(R)-hydroxyalkanoic acid synthase subunit PhaC [Ectothiorhodospira sp. PHS-1]EHQ51090.1 poly(R)-hydroxyalkanoic acid synthase, class III, PhaC subunit [Ectothiorhodospira sp. PHS-1]